MDQTSKLLAQLAERCARNLSTDATAQGYLRAKGITDESIWRRYRLGAGAKSFLDDFTADEMEQLKTLKLVTWNNRLVLAGSGISIPTYDPRETTQPVGFVRLCAGQNKHLFATEPKGLACPPDIDRCARIIIVDAPLMMLRMAQVDATGVVLAETPEVLPPLADWLKTKTVIIATHKREGLAALQTATEALRIKAHAMVVQANLSCIGEESLHILGLGKESLQAQQPAPEPAPITPLLLKRLVDYAQARLKGGAGLEALKTRGIDDAEFIKVFGLGFLPVDFREALTPEDQRSLAGLRIANALVLPAYDEQGTVVDILTLSAHPRGSAVELLPANAGLLGPHVATAFDETIITTSSRLAGTLFKSGKRNVILLRRLQDARNNAKRLWNSGVRAATIMAHREADEIAAVLSTAGIVVQRGKFKLDLDDDGPGEGNAPSHPVPPSHKPPTDVTDTPPAEKLLLVNHDTKTARAVFKAREATYTLETDITSGTKLETKIEANGKIHLDRFDLAIEAQRRRFALSAAMRTQVPFEQIGLHLIEMLEEVRRLWNREQNPLDTPTVVISDQERKDALAFLRRPDLLSAIAEDLTALGWIGEENNKRLLYLVSISRKLPQPLSAVLLASSGSGKSTGIETCTELVPPEDVMHVSRLTDSALYYHGGNSLNHKLLTIDEFDALSPEVVVALRILQSRGALSQSHTQRDAYGKTVIQFSEARGPVAVLTSSAGVVEEQLLSRCIEVPVDESPEQTKRIVTAHLRRQTDMDYMGAGGTRSKVIHRHRNIQRLLVCKPVAIPFADRIDFPASSVKHRRTLEKVLGLIQASALIHQYQRLRQKNSAGEEIIIADHRDFEIALALSADFVTRSTDELSRNARDVLGAIQAAQLLTFDVNDLKRLKPEWTRHKVRSGLEELLALEILFSPGRTRPRQYRLNVTAAWSATAPQIRLRSEGEAKGELAKNGETPFTNTTPDKATG